MTSTRHPAVAGKFYPADPLELARLVDRLLRQSEATHLAHRGTTELPKALIVPHAGFRFSGAIAAAAYARLKPAASHLRRVVLFGPSHRVPVRGMALPSAAAFATPMGSVPLDIENLDRLREIPGCVTADEPHAGEHSLEVQLPFLQQLLPDFRLTPVAVGQADAEQVADALRAVWGGPETLVLISSDLSHYHPYRDAQQFDERSSRAIMSLAHGKIRSKEACGWRGVNGMLRFARETGLTPTTLDLLNSGDTTGGRERVVGYGAWAFAREAVTGHEPLSDSDNQTLVKLAQAALARAVAGKPSPTVNVGSFTAALQRPGATFVTLTHQGRLRGCLGSLQAFRPLAQDVVERAWATALKDPRFKPVQARELTALELEIAILSPPAPLSFRDAQNLLEQLEPGEDGLIIEDQGHRATFLPKVWAEIPDRVKFLTRLLQKAGLAADHWSTSLRAWRYRTHRIGAPAARRSGS